MFLTSLKSMTNLTFIFISCQKPDNLSLLCKGLIRECMKIPLPDKSDREILLRHFMRETEIDYSVLAKYL